VDKLNKKVVQVVKLSQMGHDGLTNGTKKTVFDGEKTPYTSDTGVSPPTSYSERTLTRRNLRCGLSEEERKGFSEPAEWWLEVVVGGGWCSVVG
jgi:hypothetical protein